MAIKISGSTIIDDSRNIVNAGVTTVGVLTGTDAKFSGTVEANEFLGTGTKLSGIVTSIVAGSNISVDQSTGQVTITGLANTANVVSETINTGTLNVTGITTLAGDTNIIGNITSNVTLVSTDGGSAAAPELKLWRNSATPADADYLGQIKFAGESDTGVERNYAKITGKIGDASNGTEDGIIEIAHIKDGSQNISARWNSETLQLINDTQISVAGTATFSGPIDANGTADFDLLVEMDDVNVSSALTSKDINVSSLLTATNINATGIVSSTDGRLIAGVGVQTSGGYIGTGVTTLDFRGNGLSTVTTPSLGFSTVFVDFNGQGAIWGKNETNFSASEGQTTFTKTYQPGYVDVFLNGVRLIDGDNYTATNGTSVGLTTATNAGDKVDIIAYNGTGAAELSVARTVGLVTATSGQTVFTVPSYDVGSDSLDVFVNGIKLEPTEFTETNGTTITLAVGAGAGDILQAYAYDTSGGNYWQLTGNTLHRSTYNNPVAIGTDTQNGDSYLTVGQPGAAGTSLFVYGGARITGILTVGEGSITLDGSTNQISGLSGGMTVGTGASIFSPESNVLTLGTNNSEALRIDSSQRLLVGSTSFTGEATAVLEGSSAGGTTQAQLWLNRGSVPVTDLVLGQIIFGDNTASGRPGAMIQARADSSWANNDYPTRLIFATTADGASSTTERLTINNKGRVVIGAVNEVANNNGLQITDTTSPGITIGLNDTDVTSGNTIGQFRFYGNDSDGTYQEVANIKTIAATAHATGDKHGAITFSTCDDGSTSVNERCRILKDATSGLSGVFCSGGFHSYSNLLFTCDANYNNGGNDYITFSERSNEIMRLTGDKTILMGTTVTTSNSAGNSGGTGTARLMVEKEYASGNGLNEPQEVMTLRATNSSTTQDGYAAALVMEAEGETYYQRGAYVAGGAEDVTASSRDGYFTIGISKYGSAYVERFHIDGSTGNITASDTTIGALSDQRFKKNVTDYEYPIDKFKQIRPRSFEWINNVGLANTVGIASTTITVSAGAGQTQYNFYESALNPLETNGINVYVNDTRLKGGQYEYDAPYVAISTSVTINEGDTVKLVGYPGIATAYYHPEGTQRGFIAQELEQVDTNFVSKYLVPSGDPDRELLSEDDNNRAYTANLGGNDAMYISIIQQLITRIETLEAQVGITT